MADLYIGFNRGADLSPDKATVDSSATGKDVELHILSTVQVGGITRGEIARISEAITRYVLDGRTTTLKI